MVTHKMILKLSAVIIPFNRIREDLGDIVELADSIRRVGLLHPLVITESYELIAGYRRYVAANAIGLEDIEVKLLRDLSPIERYTIELEENIRRKQLTWQEESKAKAELHRLLIEQHGQRGVGQHDHPEGWSLHDTATMLGESIGKVSEDIRLAKHVDDPAVGNRKSRIEAIRTMKRVEEIELLKQAADELRQGSDPNSFAFGRIDNDDSIKLLATLEADSVDLLLTDPPFGIGVDESRWSRESTVPIYADSDGASTIMTVMKVMREAFRLLKPGHYAFMFCAAQDTGLWADILGEIGYKVMGKPLIWCKGRGSLTDFQTQFASAYETFLCAWKPDGTNNLIDRRPFAKVLSDVFHYPRPHERWHKLERHVDLLKDLIETASVGGNFVLDPFCGGGSTLAAAYLTARRFHGIEVDPLSWGRACERMRRLEAGETDDDVEVVEATE